MPFGWNRSEEPRSLGELWQRLNKLVDLIPDVVILRGKSVVGGAAGTKIAHGRFPQAPKDVWAKWAPGTSGSPQPFVTAFDQQTVTVVSATDMKVDLLIFF